MSEKVIFTRIFMACTGFITVVSALLLLGVTIARLLNPPPRGFQMSRWVAVVFTFGFLLSFLLSGFCWLFVSLSKRQWNSIS